MASDNPSLTSYTIDLSTGTVGLIYGFKLVAKNHSGKVETSALNVALASLPKRPSTVPTSDPSITRQDRLGVIIETFTSANDGGSFILSYNIQYDDGHRGDYRDVFQLSPTLTISGNVVEAGAQYRVRYRAQNFNGWGEFSDVAYILAATVPDKPNAPKYVSSTSTSIRLLFIPPANNGGSVILGYKLFYDTIQVLANY